MCFAAASMYTSCSEIQGTGEVTRYTVTRCHVTRCHVTRCHVPRGTVTRYTVTRCHENDSETFAKGRLL